MVKHVQRSRSTIDNHCRKSIWGLFVCLSLHRLSWCRSKMKVSIHTARLSTRLARARDIDDLFLAPALVCRQQVRYVYALVPLSPPLHEPPVRVRVRAWPAGPQMCELCPTATILTRRASSMRGPNMAELYMIREIHML